MKKLMMLCLLATAFGAPAIGSAQDTGYWRPRKNFATPWPPYYPYPGYHSTRKNFYNPWPGGYYPYPNCPGSTRKNFYNPWGC